MITKYNLNKTTQATAYLLEKEKGRMPYLKLLKLLYLADRESLQESEHTITGDHYVSMRNGPVLSETYDIIKNQNHETKYWQECFLTSEYDIRIINPPGYGELSQYDLEILDKIYSKFGNLDRWGLVNFTHELPEWVDPGTSSKEIPLQEILLALGYAEKDALRVINNLEYQTKVEMLLE